MTVVVGVVVAAGGVVVASAAANGMDSVASPSWSGRPKQLIAAARCSTANLRNPLLPERQKTFETGVPCSPFRCWPDSPERTHGPNQHRVNEALLLDSEYSGAPYTCTDVVC